MQRNREAEKQERQTGKEAERQTVCLRPPDRQSTETETKRQRQRDTQRGKTTPSKTPHLKSPLPAAAGQQQHPALHPNVAVYARRAAAVDLPRPPYVSRAHASVHVLNLVLYSYLVPTRVQLYKY